MINFASLFNQFRSSSNNAVNDLLEQQNVPLSKLIDEDSFINEYKSGNTKLIEYMTYSKVKQMIEYITVVGTGDDKKRNFKFPLTASDILSAEIPSVQDFLLPQGKLYEQVKTIVQETVSVNEQQQRQKDKLKQKQQIQKQDNEQDQLDNLILQNQKEKEQVEGGKNKQASQDKEITVIKDSLEEPTEESVNEKPDEQKAQETTAQNFNQNAQQKPEQQSQPQKQQLQTSSPKQQSTAQEQQHQKQQQTTQTSQQQQSPLKKVQKIIKVQKVHKVQVPPLITQLIKYFDQQINYILTGYVCKVLTSLFNKKTNQVIFCLISSQMMQYLFTDQNVYKLIAHIESRSVGEFLLKVLTYESSKWAAERATLFSFLLNKLAENNSIHVLSNFSSFICETIVKAADNTKTNSPVQQFTQIFFTPQVVTIAIKNVMSDHENVCIYNAPILLTYLTNVPFTLPKDEKVIQQFKFLLGMFIDKSLQKLNVKHTERPKLGFGRIKIIEILSYILKQNLIGSRQMFASRDQAFPVLFELCRNYEMNNVLHNEVVKLISLSFNDKLLSQALLKNNILLNFLLQESLEDVEIQKGKGKQKFRKGFIGHIVQIARLVQENASKGNEAAMKILQTDEFDKVLSILVEKQVSEGNKNLGGFSLKRQLKSDIMFQKQDIITHYIDFLTHSPKPVFEPQPVHVNIEHPDFLQEMERQLEENLSLQQQTKQQQINSGLVVPKQEEASQTPPLIQTIETQIKVEINFFKGHLDYDIQKLMEEL